MAPPTAAGYVVCDNEAIWGYGATEYEARADFETTMRSAGIAVLADDEDPAGRLRILGRPTRDPEVSPSIRPLH